MSNSYKKAMDKMELSDELKEKIILNTSHQKSHEKNRSYRKIYFPRAAGLAACFTICMLSYYAVSNYYHSPIDTVPIQTPANTNKPDASGKPPVQNHPSINTDDKQAVQDNVNAPTAAASSSSRYQEDEKIFANDIDIPKTAPSQNNHEPAENDAGIVQNEITDTPDIPSDSNDFSEPSAPPLLNTSPPGDENLNNNDNPTQSGNDLPLLSPTDDKLSLIEIEQTLGYEIKVPKYVPADYELSGMTVLFGKLAEITYENETDKLCYRTAKGTGGISGDYNKYENIEPQSIDNLDITLKGNGTLYYNAEWTEDDESYAVTSKMGLPKDEMIHIVSSVSYTDQENAV